VRNATPTERKNTTDDDKPGPAVKDADEIHLRAERCVHDLLHGCVCMSFCVEGRGWTHERVRLCVYGGLEWKDVILPVKTIGDEKVTSRVTSKVTSRGHVTLSHAVWVQE
jgi:hypothetical protein